MLFSFIIPTYNTVAFLPRCLDSILQQDFADFEVLVVNDGSTDGTAAVLESYAERDPRIRIFSRPNGGQGAARNFGISNACGDYIWFVDSDDWLLRNSIARVATILVSTTPDVFVARFEYTFENSPSTPSPPPSLEHAGRVIDVKASAETFGSYSCWVTPPWRLITRRDLLVKSGIRFAEGLFYEDHPFAIELMLTAERVYIDDRATYAYYQRPGSTTHSSDRKVYDFIAIRRRCLELFAQHGVLERFAPITATYIAPLNFFLAHVDEPYRKPFLQRLNAELTSEQEALVARLGSPELIGFMEAVRAGRPRKIRTWKQRSRLRRLFTAEGQRKARAIARAKVRAALGRAFRKTHSWLAGMETGLPDATGRPFLSAAPSARLEHIAIDVRVAPQPRPYVIIGEDSHVGGRFVFERGLGTITVGARSSIGGGSLIICSQEEGIRIGNHVMLSWDVTITDTDAHSLDPEIRHSDAYEWKRSADDGRVGAYKNWEGVACKPVVIENDAWVGFGATILKGVRIGRGAVVGAKSVVTRDVADYTVVAGNPARFVRMVPRQRWSWEDIVAAMNGDPAMRPLLDAAYLQRDVAAALGGYRCSEEFHDTALLIRALVPAARTLIDAGAGNGVASIAFALEGFEVTAVEPSTDDLVGCGAIRRMLAAAERIDPSVSSRVSVIPATIDDAKLPESVDVALCRQAVHHFPDPARALGRLYQALRPGGIALLVREHVIFDDADRQLFLDSHPMHRYYGGEQAYTREQYEQFAQSAGFEVERVLGFLETPINYWPHSKETVASLKERDVAGRPYTFVLRRPFQ